MEYDVRKLNLSLASTANELQAKSAEMEAARNAYLLAKDEYERAFAQEQVTLKTANPDMTQTDLKAQATVNTAKIKLDMRVKEAAYRSLSTSIKSLQSKLESLKEISFNIRKEMGLQS